MFGFGCGLSGSATAQQAIVAWSHSNWFAFPTTKASSEQNSPSSSTGFRLSSRGDAGGDGQRRLHPRNSSSRR